MFLPPKPEHVKIKPNLIKSSLNSQVWYLSTSSLVQRKREKKTIFQFLSQNKNCILQSAQSVVSYASMLISTLAVLVWLLGRTSAKSKLPSKFAVHLKLYIYVATVLNLLLSLHCHAINVVLPSCETLQIQKTLGRLQILLDARVPLHGAYGAQVCEGINLRVQACPYILFLWHLIFLFELPR
jgi:hypothetical protein